MNRQLLSLFLLFVALFNLTHQAADQKLPKLWKSDPSTKPDGFYRFFYRLEILDSDDPANHKSFMIEEWAHLREARLRLDIVALHEQGTRRTILYFGDTDEIFYYEPFKCHTVAKLSQALYPELVGIFPENGDLYMKFGIGSLWKYVETSNTGGPFVTTVNPSAFLPLAYSSALSSRLSYPPTDEYKFGLDFYLSDNDDVNTLNLVLIGQKYELRILDTPNELTQSRDQLERVFQLPRGYGCTRDPKQADGDEAVYPRQMVFVGGLDPRELQLLRLDLVASRPISGADSDDSGASYDSPDRWRSHSSSVRIVSGGYRAPNGDYERNYLVFEKQESSSDRASVAKYLAGLTSGRRSTVRRTKMVWDLSNMVSDMRSRYYELDASEGRCLGYGETKSPLDVSIDLRIAPEASDFESESPPLMLTLGVELLSVIFSPEGYHLISRYQRLANKEEFVFEKRDERFKMKNMHGQVVWEGPVSFVSQFVATSSVKNGSTDSSPPEQQMVTINFYSKRVDKLLARVKLLVAESRAIDQHYLLDEIDVSTCLTRLGQARSVAGSNYVDELPNEQQLDDNLAFELEYYPLDDGLYEKYLDTQQEAAFKRQVELEFIRSLVELSAYRLDLMQITGLTTHIGRVETELASEDNDLTAAVRITGQLLDRPSLLNFIHDPGQRFSEGGQADRRAISGSQHIRSLLKESAKGCAATCDHFNCSMFSYCSGSSVCDLLLDSNNKSNPEVKVTWDPNCALYTRHSLANSIVSPHELIHLLSQTIRAQHEQPPAGSNNRDNPLSLKLDGASSSTVLLVPESIESGLLYGEELEKLAELEDDFQVPTQNELIVSGARPSTGFRQEYSILFQDQKYKSTNSHDQSVFPLAEANHMSYHDCESLCKQNDCLSFSYCRLEKQCQISGLHRKEEIGQRIEQDSGCFVMAREYPSKFEMVSQRPLTPRQTFETIGVDSLGECASDCMERVSPKCQSFYYCPVEKGRASCHLKSNNMLADNMGDIPQASNPIDSISTLSCHLYARSYLSNFDKFYGKSLPVSGFQASIYRGFEAESCASECADKAGECVGFQVCTTSGSKLVDFVCTTLSAKLNSSIVAHLEPNPGCTSFLASPGSEMYQLASSRLAEQIQLARAAAKASEASEDGSSRQERGRLSTLAIWLLRILFIAIGLAMGYGVLYGSRQSTLMRSAIRQISSRIARI